MNPPNHSHPAQPGILGILGSLFSWAVGGLGWYFDHLDSATKIITHVAQLAGLVVAFYSIRLLHRNWKNGSKLPKGLD